MEACNYVNVLLIYLLTINLMHAATWNNGGNAVSALEDRVARFLDSLPMPQDLL